MKLCISFQFLLSYQRAGKLSLVEYHDESIPRYAILSHTWRIDSKEFTFKDLMEGTSKKRLPTTRSNSAEGRPPAMVYNTSG